MAYCSNHILHLVISICYEGVEQNFIFSTMHIMQNYLHWQTSTKWVLRHYWNLSNWRLYKKYLYIMFQMIAACICISSLDVLPFSNNIYRHWLNVSLKDTSHYSFVQTKSIGCIIPSQLEWNSYIINDDREIFI